MVRNLQNTSKNPTPETLVLEVLHVKQYAPFLTEHSLECYEIGAKDTASGNVCRLDCYTRSIRVEKGDEIREGDVLEVALHNAVSYSPSSIFKKIAYKMLREFGPSTITFKEGGKHKKIPFKSARKVEHLA